MNFIKNFLHALGVYNTPELVLKDKLSQAKQIIKVEYRNNTIVITLHDVVVFKVISKDKEKTCSTDIYLEEVDELMKKLYKEYINK